MSTGIIGLGNPILTDDAVGIKVARRLQDILPKEMFVVEASAGGMELVELMLDHERIILIDAIMTEGGRAGDILRITPKDLTETANMNNMHNMSFKEALELWKQVAPERIPKEIIIFAIEVKDTTSFSEMMNPEIERVVPEVIEMVLKELE